MSQATDRFLRKKLVIAGSGVIALIAAAVSLTLLFGGAGAAGAAAKKICLSGSLHFDYRSAESGPGKPWKTKPVRNANVELWGREGALGSPRKLTTQALLTDVSNGGFQACYTPEPPRSMEQMWVRVSAESSKLWKVTNGSGATFTWNSPVQKAVSGSRSLGTRKPPSGDMRAWHAFDTVNELWWKRGNPKSNCWSSRETDNNTCTELTMQWVSQAPSDALYDPQRNTVHLAGDVPDSEHTVLHESAHFLQHRLFGGWFPQTTHCSAHWVDKTSSDTCSWTEAFADSAAAYVLGDYRYVGSNGMAIDFAHGSTYDDGDTVQGNVGGSLLDLWRTVDGGTWDRTIALLSTHHVSTFREYFTLRPTARLDTGGKARQLLRNHTIDY
ncbi:metalloprotease [Streptomyces sp. NPDC001657]|uniref:metalloprotease n=1 Tax=unclassified Streptomyces TaxID=2593676 RepID=UPI0033335CD5